MTRWSMSLMQRGATWDYRRTSLFTFALAWRAVARYRYKVRYALEAGPHPPHVRLVDPRSGERFNPPQPSQPSSTRLSGGPG